MTENMTVKELKNNCKLHKIKNYSKKNKSQLLDLINGQNDIKEENSKQSNINNETIGITLEKAWCLESNIVCNISNERIHIKYLDKFRPIVKEFLNENPEYIAIKHIGNDNKDIDFIIQHNKTLSLKTLKKYDGKICPQNIGQPSYKSFDKIWGLDFMGKYENNSERLEFIKSNINKFLNEMLKNLFCCDYEIIGFNCQKEMKIYYLKKPTNMNYFDKKIITLTRPNYIEPWNQKKQKNSEYSSLIKIGELSVGELQFHKTSRNVIKFRFFSKFLKTIE